MTEQPNDEQQQHDAPIGDPREAGEEGTVGDPRPAGEEGTVGDPRPAGNAEEIREAGERQASVDEQSQQPRQQSDEDGEPTGEQPKRRGRKRAE